LKIGILLLRRLAREVAAQLRQEKLQGKTVRIKVRFPDFQTITRQVSIGVGTDSTDIIEGLAVDLFHRRVSLKGRGVRLLGVGVGRLSEAQARQLSLFDKKKTSLEDTLDDLTARYGEKILRRGDEGW
jgi:DNA polymerase-4